MKTAIKAAALLCAALLWGASLLPGAQARELSATHHIVNGMDVYLGVMPAAAVQALPERERAEKAMHNGTAGAGAYHVNLSLFDAGTHTAIRDAQVRVSVEQVGLGSETRQLEPMSINGFVSYGNYFSMNGSRPYVIDVQIQRPGLPEAHTRFQYQTF